jgi:hypothetical protein
MFSAAADETWGIQVSCGRVKTARSFASLKMTILLIFQFLLKSTDGLSGRPPELSRAKKNAGNPSGFPAGAVTASLEIVAQGELLFACLDQGRTINSEASAAGDYRV